VSGTAAVPATIVKAVAPATSVFFKKFIMIDSFLNRTLQRQRWQRLRGGAWNWRRNKEM
jgi:hypothetical protein